MAARATRSASRKARVTEAVATGPLGALSHDELGVIVDGLADPLQPVVAVALSSTCLGLRTPLGAALKVLKGRHARVVALCLKVARWTQPGHTCAALGDAQRLEWQLLSLTNEHLAVLGMILRTHGLPRLQVLDLFMNRFDNAGVQAMCEGLGHGAAPALRTLILAQNGIGPAGAEALAAALYRGALPNIEVLILGSNQLGCEGVAALAPALRKLPALTELYLQANDLGDEGVASLVANLGKDDFKMLKKLDLAVNRLTSASCGKLAAALDSGALPRLDDLLLHGNNLSLADRVPIVDALVRAMQRRLLAAASRVSLACLYLVVDTPYIHNDFQQLQ